MNSPLGSLSCTYARSLVTTGTDYSILIILLGYCKATVVLTEHKVTDIVHCLSINLIVQLFSFFSYRNMSIRHGVTLVSS